MLKPLNFCNPCRNALIIGNVNEKGISNASTKTGFVLIFKKDAINGERARKINVIKIP